MSDLVLKNQCVPGTVNAEGLVTGSFRLERFAEPIHSDTGIRNIVELAA